MKHLIYILSLYLVLSMVSVQAQTVTLTGTLKQKSWSKTTESYCAQGSDYFVLSRPNQDDVVLQMGNMNPTRFLNQRVRVRGLRVTKSIPKPDDGLQRPVSPFGEESFQCTVFEVKQMRQLAR